ncbi:hypothetical protein [Membranihabitans marinus]|uniref:hypothetical protein n=1 Tax=Membranihabitans marinus TaxID=1227546 RepID=UPI001F1E94FF|nr:hypothetical protein [Membranihabitans marinus]
MSILNDIKKLVFGAKSMARSAGRKLTDESDEMLEEIKNTGSKVAKDVMVGAEIIGEKASGELKKIQDKYMNFHSEVEKSGNEFKTKVDADVANAETAAQERMAALRKRAEEFREELKSADNLADQDIEKTISELNAESSAIKEDLVDTAETIRQKAKNFHDEATESFQKEGKKATSGLDRLKESTEAIGESIFGKTSDVLNAAKIHAEKMGELLEKKGEALYQSTQNYLNEKDENGMSIIDRAKASLDQIKNKWNKTVDDAQKMAEEEKNKGEYVSKDPNMENLKKSELDDKDNFWRKAEAFAAGDFDKVKDVSISKIETKDNRPKPNAPGFEDQDGDGDEIIDDAIIVDED